MDNKFVITSITRVLSIHSDEHTPKSSTYEHTLKSNELIFHFSGHTTVFFDDLIFETSPNTIRFLPQGETKRYDVLRDGPDSDSCIDVFFRADRVVSPQAFVMRVSQGEKLGMLFKRLFSTWNSKTDGSYFESISLLYRIFAEMQKDTSVPKSHKSKIAPAMDIIHSEFLTRDFSIGELAAMCGMGESYFQKLFKEIHGIYPKKYIIQCKINHACDLMRLERYTVTQIAELCNFSDIYFFSRQFKEYMGITPTEFIKKYRSSK